MSWSEQNEMGTAGGDGGVTDEVTTTLAEEHALLRQAVHARAEPVVQGADRGSWPAGELTELVNYLQLEVLRQIADEEWLLFRTARTAARSSPRCAATTSS